jgi:hypothetical protein
METDISIDDCCCCKKHIKFVKDMKFIEVVCEKKKGKYVVKFNIGRKHPIYNWKKICVECANDFEITRYNETSKEKYLGIFIDNLNSEKQQKEKSATDEANKITTAIVKSDVNILKQEEFLATAI